MHGISGTRNRPASVNGQASSTSSVPSGDQPGQPPPRPAQGANPPERDDARRRDRPDIGGHRRPPAIVLERRADLDERAGDLVGDAPDVEHELPGDAPEPGAAPPEEQVGLGPSGPTRRHPDQPGETSIAAIAATIRASRHRRRRPRSIRTAIARPTATCRVSRQAASRTPRTPPSATASGWTTPARARRGSSTGRAACTAARTGSRRRSAPRAS